jgi:hypothetical protein
VAPITRLDLVHPSPRVRRTLEASAHVQRDRIPVRDGAAPAAGSQARQAPSASRVEASLASADSPIHPSTSARKTRGPAEASVDQAKLAAYVLRSLDFKHFA